MKPLFKFLFNLFRNASLIIVIGLLGLIAYLNSNEQAANDFFSSIEDEKTEKIPYKEEESQFAALEEASLENYKSKKFKIGLKQGHAYLRPSQIMYIESKPIEIVTTNGQKIAPKMTMENLKTLLNSTSEECFFKTRTAILNCNYVQQLVKESHKIDGKYTYQHVVSMEDGHTINISPPKATELNEILDKSTF